MFAASVRYSLGSPFAAISDSGSNTAPLKFIAVTIIAPMKRDSSFARYGAICVLTRW